MPESFSPLQTRILRPLTPVVQNRSPRITVVVPTKNRSHLVEEAISALRRLEYPNYSVLVVDQSTDDQTRLAVERIRDEDERIEYRATRSIGSSEARNLGWCLSTADVVAYVDDDCMVTRSWLTALAREYEDPSVEAVFGRLLPYEPHPRSGTEVGYKDEPNRQRFDSRCPPWYVGHGGNMSFRREALLSVGGFDPLLSAGGLLQSNEDQDIAYRLLARGHRIVYTPSALVYHRHWKSWTAQSAMERAYGVGAGSQFLKYLRCRDLFGIVLFVLWIWQMGVRRLLAGVLKWQSARVMYLGCCQLVYPWVGVAYSLHYDIDRNHVVYLSPDEASELVAGNVG